MKRQRADERSRPMTPRRVNDHSSRLVDNRQRVVLEVGQAVSGFMELGAGMQGVFQIGIRGRF